MVGDRVLRILRYLFKEELIISSPLNHNPVVNGAQGSGATIRVSQHNTPSHLEKATVSTGKEWVLSEGNAAYNWSRCDDELESQLSKHGSLKKLYFYHHQLTTVFGNTMFGPEGRPQHCCAWLGIASSFPECASAIVPEEVTTIGRDAVLYVGSLIESIMGGLEGLINILVSKGGFGALENHLLPEQVASYINHASKVSIPSSKSPRLASAFPLPGHESYLENDSSVKMLEAVMQRLTNWCSVLNDMEPICILNHVFVLREYTRDYIIGNFSRRLLAVLKLIMIFSGLLFWSH